MTRKRSQKQGHTGCVIPDSDPEFLKADTPYKYGLNRNFYIICLLLFLNSSLFAGFVHNVNKGNKFAGKNKYDEALLIYREAEKSDPDNPLVYFNIGNALYKRQQYDEALKEYEKSTYSKDIAIQSKAYYNIGNTMYKTGRLQEALSNYKKCLDLNQNDEDAKYNVEYVQRKIKEMMKQQKGQEQEEEEQQQQQAQGKEQKKGDEQKKEQENKEKARQEKDKKEKQKKEQEQKQAKDKEQEQKEKQRKEQEKKEGMSKEDAERLLEAFSDEDKKPKKEEMIQAPGLGHKYEDW
ncbi:tetratricopeptide repeat protein [bacterium]